MLDMTVSAVSRYENMNRRPSIELVFGVEVIFGEPARTIFPAFYSEVEDAVMLRALEFWR